MTEREANPTAAINDVFQTHLNDYSPAARRRRRQQQEAARDSWYSLDPHSRPRLPIPSYQRGEIA